MRTVSSSVDIGIKSNGIPDDLRELLKNAPRNCWLAVDLVEMKIIGRYDDLVHAVQEIKGVLKPLIIWSPEEGFDFSEPSA